MIAVVGSINLDLVANVRRMSQPGETVLACGYAEYAGGKGANQAVAAARAGGSVLMIGQVGRDAAGARLKHSLKEDGINVASVLETDAPTGRALIEVAEDSGQNRIVVIPGANHASYAQADALAALQQASVVVLQCEIPTATVAEAVKTARAADATVLLNYAPAVPLEPETLKHTDVLVVNESEAAALLGGDTDGVAANPLHAAKRLAAHVRRDAVITLGAQGAAYAGVTGSGLVPGFHVTATDTTAAGDAFVGALAVALHERVPLQGALRFACAAGAEAATRPGAQPSLPSRAAIDAQLESSPI